MARAIKEEKKKKKTEREEKKRTSFLICVYRAKDEGPWPGATVASYRKILISCKPPNNGDFEQIYRVSGLAGARKKNFFFSSRAPLIKRQVVGERPSINIKVSRNVSARQNIRDVPPISDE